jgi:hypothetical protein
MIDLYSLQFELMELYKKLCDKHNIINCEFIMGNFKEIMESDYYFNHYYELTPKQMLNALKDNHTMYYHSFMYTVYIWYKGKLKFRIIFPIENYLNMIYGLAQANRLNDTNEIFDFCRTVLTHEIGHVIDTTNQFNELAKTNEITFKFLDKWNEKQQKNQYKDIKKYFKESNDLLYLLSTNKITKEEYDTGRSKAYFSMKDEANANNAVGLDFSTVVRLNTKYQASIDNLIYHFR